MKHELMYRGRYGDFPQVGLHMHEAPDPVAVFAIGLVERWGMVAATPDGEDSAGRAKMRLATPIELAERAVQTAEATYAALRETGHLIELPSLEEIRDRARAEAERN